MLRTLHYQGLLLYALSKCFGLISTYLFFFQILTIFNALPYVLTCSFSEIKDLFVPVLML